jgi:hypothetical protein
MKRGSLAVMALLLSFIQLISAREVMNIPSTQGQSIYLNLGLDPTFVAGVGYAYTLPISAIKRSLTLYGEATLPVLRPDLGDYQLQIGTRIPIVGYKNWGLLNRLNLKNTGQKTWMYTANGFSLEECLLGGYFAPKSFVGVEFGYTKFVLTHYKHTDEYREQVFEDAQDGWYWNTGGIFTVGAQGGFRIGKRFEVGLRAGAFRTEQWNFPSGSPFLVNLTLNYHL